MLLNELKPCSCGCEKLWVIHYKAFLKNRYYVECTKCRLRTKSFRKQDQAVQVWNKIQIKQEF